VENDPLTGISNRRAFTARLQSALQSASPEQPLSVLHLDLDFFKEVNARYGHPAGDHELAVAVSVVERVRQAVAARTLYSIKGNPFSVTISAGVVQLQPGETILAMWQRVSAKALEAKSAGRNRVVS
jgi:diguanylate cyclase